MGLDLTKFGAVQSDPVETGSSSSQFRNISFCTPDSHAEGNGIPLDHFFLNEGDSGDLDNSQMTDLGESVEDLYILDYFQYYEWRDADDNDALAFNSLQFKNSFNPVLIRNVDQKKIDALPFWAKDDEPSILNDPQLSGYKRSGRYNIWAVAKLDGEWKRVKIKASASTIHGAEFDKEKKRPSPFFKDELPDSLIGFIKKGDAEVGAGYSKFLKCKITLEKVGSRNRRIAFHPNGVASEKEAEMVSKNYQELQEAIANENRGKIEHFAKEMASWEDVHNPEYIAAYLQNPLAATYNTKKHFGKFLLSPEKSLLTLQEGKKSEAQEMHEKVMEAFDIGVPEDAPEVQYVESEGKA